MDERDSRRVESPGRLATTVSDKERVRIGEEEGGITERATGGFFRFIERFFGEDLHPIGGQERDCKGIALIWGFVPNRDKTVSVGFSLD